MRDVEQLGKARSRKNVMVSSQARFTYPGMAKTDNPGPGHYGSGMVYGNLLKQVGWVPGSCSEDGCAVPCGAMLCGAGLTLRCSETTCGGSYLYFSFIVLCCPVFAFSVKQTSASVTSRTLGGDISLNNLPGSR